MPGQAQDPVRPDPDALLALAQAEETSARRGKLKIFFGATAGVGKSFTMLEAARDLAGRGVDVVIGWLEPHARPETMALAAGLERVAPRSVEHRGVTIAELDLDAVKTRRPAVVLVDELAHTNAPGSRHAKRWQDVEELLDFGLDVFTTLNVQHLASLNDLVGQITGVIVRETVPDQVFDAADQVELVDLPQEKLLERLREGKIYLAEQAGRAIESFFRPGNLIALRELALRKTAGRVEAQMQRYRELHGIAPTWPVVERLLVAVSSGPSAPRLVRAARRFAEQLRAEWIVAYVETPAELRRDETSKARIAETLRLAEQLGAETITLTGTTPALALLAFARRRNVSKIVLGKSTEPRWRTLLLGSVRTTLEREGREIDLAIIAGTEEPDEVLTALRRRPRRTARSYLTAAAVVLATTALAAVLFPYLERTNLVMLYLLAAVGVAWRLGRRAATLAAVLGVLAFDFFFVPPYLTFAVADSQYLITFGVMLATAFLIGSLTADLRAQADAAREREERASALYALSRALVSAGGGGEDRTQAILQAAAEHISRVFLCQVHLLLPDPGERRLRERASLSFTYTFDAREQAVAQWVFEMGRPAGRTTDTLPAAKGFYLPLATAKGLVGVLGVHLADPESLASPAQRHFLETFANQIALALE